tara:strand:+ start:522 stop:956 length:435 start_codon:yes stop_codon:yes gene_type:complete
MVASVSGLASFIPTKASVGRPDDTRVNAENISSTLRRVVALTAKFGPDPATGSPFQLISGKDVEAAETNDLQRLAEANKGLVSPLTSFQAQSIRSENEITEKADTSKSAQAVQQSLQSGLSSFFEIAGTGNTASERGVSVDIKV